MVRMDVVWLLGRGVSMSCGFSWSVPRSLNHRHYAPRIREELRRAQSEALDNGEVDFACLDRLLSALRNSPAAHCFVTTNWNTVLDVALRRHGYPRALHLNGSIDDEASEILTEHDGQYARRRPLEEHEAFRRLAQAEAGVLAGLSLRSRLDRELLRRLGRAHRRPARSRWVVVNDKPADARGAASLLRDCLRSATVHAACEPFDAWVSAGMPGLEPVTPCPAAAGRPTAP